MYLSNISSVSKKCPSLSMIMARTFREIYLQSSVRSECNRPFPCFFAITDWRRRRHSGRPLRYRFGVEACGTRIGLDAVANLVPRHQFGIAHADGFGVDHRHAEMRLQL